MENYSVLERRGDHFEKWMAQPMTLQIDAPAARYLANGTVGLRLRVTRSDTKLKLSQNREPAVVELIVRHLEGEGAYSSEAFATEIRRANSVAP